MNTPTLTQNLSVCSVTQMSKSHKLPLLLVGDTNTINTSRGQSHVCSLSQLESRHVDLHAHYMPPAHTSTTPAQPSDVNSICLLMSL